MSGVINVHDAKTHFSKLLERVAQGEELVIGKAGRPVARLVPFVERPARRRAGTAKGMIRIAPDFDAALPEDVLRSFEGGDLEAKSPDRRR